MSVQCCVFPAAVVLLDSWHVLLRNLWDEHLNHTLVLNLKQTLERLIHRNRHTQVWFDTAAHTVVTIVTRVDVCGGSLGFCCCRLQVAQNGNAFCFSQRFQEETDLTQFPKLSSSPEKLLQLTSELLARWLHVGCLPSIGTCTLPTLPPAVDRKDYGPSRARLLTTRAISSVEESQLEQKTGFTKLTSNSGPPPLSYSASVWSPLLLRLYRWLLP